MNKPIPPPNVKRTSRTEQEPGDKNRQAALPCPFCGRDNQQIDKYAPFILCPNCLGSAPIGNWNNRVNCANCKKWEEQCHETAMECDRLEVFARLVEPYIADHWCHDKSTLGQALYNACVQIRSLIYRFSDKRQPLISSISQTSAATGEKKA